MPSSQIRRMNPQMAGFSDAQIQMAAQQMESMANNPAMLNQMKEQVKNMSPEELEQARMQAAGGAPTGMPSAANGMQSLADMTPEQLKQQAEMMKSMSPDQLRKMNPAMANFSDAQINMTIQQMENMSKNPEMLKQLSAQMKGMSPEEIEKMRKMAEEGGMGPGDDAGDASGKNPMDILNNSNPAQIKQMLNMARENPSFIKDMLRSSNPAMADQMTDEQIEKTINAFANMDDKKIGWVLKLIGWAQQFKNSSKAKIVLFLFLSMGFFVFSMLFYLARKHKGLGVDADISTGIGNEEIPTVPEIESEF